MVCYHLLPIDHIGDVALQFILDVIETFFIEANELCLTDLKDNSEQTLTIFLKTSIIAFVEVFFSSFMMASGSVSLILSSSNSNLREAD